MKNQRFAATLVLGTIVLVGPGALLADSDYKVVTIITAETLETARQAAPVDRVSDQPIRHVMSAEGNLGLGVVHRPVVEAGSAVRAIQHHKQSEVYRVMSGSGTLVTSTRMRDSDALDPAGYVVSNLTGPSDVGIIEDVEHSQLIGEGDVVIIPAGVAHGFSEITDPITYMVVRVDPEELVKLK